MMFISFLKSFEKDSDSIFSVCRARFEENFDVNKIKILKMPIK